MIGELEGMGILNTLSQKVNLRGNLITIDLIFILVLKPFWLA